MFELAPMSPTIVATSTASQAREAPRSRPRLLPLRRPSRGTAALYRAAAGVTAPRGLVGIALAAVLSAALGFAGAPVAIPWIIAAGGIHYAGTIVRHALSAGYTRRVHGEFGLPLHPVVDPTEIESDELRASYLSILRTHEELRVTLDEHDPVSVELRSLYRACSDAVELAGRTALLGGPLRRYLEGRARATIAEDIVRLDGLAEGAGDREAREMFDRASAVRRREAELHVDVDVAYARMKARLEVVAATVATAAAASLHFCTLGVDRSAATRESLIEHIDALDEDLRFLADTITADVAA